MILQKKFIKALLLTGLLAGGLDALAACIQYKIRTGNNPARVFRNIASGVFGNNALTQNLYTMAAWGLLFHLLIAMLFTIFFFLCYPQIKLLIKNKFAAGIAYGLFVWTIMNLIVVPLTYGTGINIPLKNALIAMGILIIAIGLPVSLLADHYYSKKDSLVN
jgi:uncharacterized membrane protein YagU involved in acid resistance